MKDYYREIPPRELVGYGFEFFSITARETGIHTSAHMHPAVEMLYIISGSFEIGIDRRIYKAGKGDMVIFRSNVIHTIDYIPNGEIGEYYVLKATPELICQTYSGENSSSQFLKFLRRKEDDVSVVSADCLPIEIKQVWERMIQEYYISDEQYFAIERAYVGVMLSLLVRHILPSDTAADADSNISEKTVSLIYDCIDYINDNYASDITAKDCAEYVHLSYSYFAKLFKEVVGKSFKEHLIDVRLAKAYNKIISDTQSITEIAYSCGYRNLSHFIFEFRKRYGVSPSETRKKCFQVYR